MCEIMTALAIASSVTEFAGMSADASSENEARAANRASAISDYNRQIEEGQRNYIAESRATQQKAFDEEVKARDALARAKAEAATQGAAGVSVNAVLNEIIGIGGRTQNRLDDEQKINSINFQNRMDSAHAETKSRLNANRSVSGPSLLGLAINIGSDVYGNKKS